MKWIGFIISALITTALIWFLNNKQGDIPPMGNLLSPFAGFWQNNESQKISSEELKINGLKDEVTVLMDDNLVPHIFAKNNHDLYMAQGYITAKYRLWQMEFQTMAAAGRLCELIGDKALPYDRQQRRFGMVYAAEVCEKSMEQDAESKEAIDAYTAGVNDYITSLPQKKLPVEYKILAYKPEPWTNLKCALLLKYMTYDLAGWSDDWRVTNVLKKYGTSAIDSLFTNHTYVNDPIMPVGTPWDFTPEKTPAATENILSEVSTPAIDHEPNRNNGSNNWAVNGSKTSTGLPILCGDPHLGLNLPSIWYQMQLVSPDCNVTGVTLPGTPCVIIGFNEHIAWSETNVDADVLDWYSVKFKDEKHDEYFFNNEWKKTEKRIEVIKVRGGKDVFDTKDLVRKDMPQGYAMRWIGHDPSIEMKTFLHLNRASNYDEYVEALSHFTAPAQNFVYADAHNNIAIWSNGKYPLKYKDQGKFLLDGSNPANEWQGWIPHEQDPHVKNPPRGFVSSANQTPVDSTYPYYLNWRFETETRAQRINERLAQMKNITEDSMRLLQYDEKNMIAAFLKDTMIAQVDETKLNKNQKQLLQSLRGWNNFATAESANQTLFNAWWNNLKTAIWEDEFGGKEMIYPTTDISMRTVKFNTNRKWIDNSSTPQVETLTDLINQTYTATCGSLEKEFGGNLEKWVWAMVKKTHVTHLLRIPAFSNMLVYTGGSAGIINASGSDHGPSWRMIVELGKEPKAYGLYPGGQSGNPGSPFYDNMIDAWSKGEQKELLILHSAEEKNQHVVSSITLKK